MDFNKTYAEYADGFGDLEKDFWLGNEKIHALTEGGNCELVIEFERYDGDGLKISYATFTVGDANGEYE